MIIIILSLHVLSLVYTCNVILALVINYRLIALRDALNDKYMIPSTFTIELKRNTCERLSELTIAIKKGISGVRVAH